MRLQVSIALLCAIMGLVAIAADPFVPFDEIPLAERLPLNAQLSVGEDGVLCVNGQPRYLAATIFYDADGGYGIHTSGYSDDLRWLYEEVPGYENMQRLGIDAVGFEAGREWMRMISPTAAPKWKMSGCFPATDRFTSAFAGQPAPYVDFTPAPWGHGGLTPKDNPQLPPEAWTSGSHHWVPYSVIHPAGRNVWLTMWREGVKRYSKLHVKPWVYELMNEPSVFDTGVYAKARFKETGREYNPVDYLKFIERNYVSLIEEGVRTVHEFQPGACATVQPCIMRAKGIDIYSMYSKLDVICSPTGGGPLPVGHLLRAVADGKPIVDGETYIGKTCGSVRNALLKQFQRGFNASYTFKWSRRPCDWARGGDAAVEKTLAQKIPFYNYINPYVVPTEALLGFRMAKRDILEVGDLFTLRDRGTPRRIAVLYSNPTERLAFTKGHVCNQLFDMVVSELDYGHLNPDVIFEEQLRDEPKRIDRYDVLVAAGVEAVYGETPALIRQWMKKGGVLVLVGEKMAKDEYGNPNGEKYPGAFYCESRGRSSAEIGQMVLKIAIEKGVNPNCETLDGSEVEVTDAKRGGFRGWILSSRKIGPQVIRFKPLPECREMLFMTRTVREDNGKLKTHRRELLADENGYYTLLLEQDDSTVLVSGLRQDVFKKYAESADASWLPALSSGEARKEVDRRMSLYRAKRMTKAGGYHPVVNRTKAIDLRRSANLRRLTSDWWGQREIEGVPFEFIRSDQNDFRDVVELTRKTGAFEYNINSSVLHFYFVYTGSFKGEVKYEDGSAECFEAPESASKIKRVWRWTVSRCDKRVTQLILKASLSEIYAITIEAPCPHTVVVPPEEVAGVRSLSGKSIVPEWKDGILKLTHGENPLSWSCARIRFDRAIKLPSEWKGGRFVFEVNRQANRFGAYASAPGLQVNLGTENGFKGIPHYKFALPRKDDLTSEFKKTDDDPATWETLSVEMKPEVMAAGAVSDVVFQYKLIQWADPSPLAIRNMRFEERE